MKNLEEIAHELQVSISTVSRALSGKPGVSERKRREIINYAGKHGFMLNLHASSLRTGKGYGITLITSFKLPEIVQYRNLHLLEKGQKEFSSVRVIISSKDNELDELITSAISDKTRGIILSNPRGDISDNTKKLVINREIPLLSIDCGFKDIDSIFIDRSAGTYQVARMFLLSGCKYPVYFSNESLKKPDARLQGIIKGHSSMGKNPAEIKLHPYESDSFKGGFETAVKLLNTGPVDAIFAFDDAMAIGVLRALRKYKIKVPEEVKVIGFDNIPVAEHLPISLTTVAQPVEEVAETAIEIISKKLVKYDGSPVKRQFRTYLIGRESAPVKEHSLREQIFK